jgi:hypothetical protein
MSRFSFLPKPRKVAYILAFVVFVCGGVFLSNSANSNITAAPNETESINGLAHTGSADIVSEVFSVRDTSSTQPILVTMGDIRREYEEIAVIRATARGLGNIYASDLYEALRKEARLLGAQAVIRVQFGSTSAKYTSFPWVVGTAIKYK